MREFAIGMGPAIIKKQGKETLYSLRLLPIGGYCSLEGEDEESDNERAFGNQKLWKRFLVISAGAILNVLLGFVIFIVLVAKQGTIITTDVSSLESRAYIAQSGICEGDKIVAVNGHKVGFYNDIAYYLSDIKGDEKIDVTVKRDGKKLDFSFLPSLEKQSVTYDSEGASIVTSVNGIEEQSYVAYTDEQKDAYKELAGKTKSSERYIIGVVTKREHVSPKNIIPEAYHYTTFVVKLVYSSLGELIRGKTGIDQFSGPVGVAAVVDTAVHDVGYRTENLLNLIAMLTINLGIFNLLPLPALDGGRLLFLLIELVMRKPVPPEKEGLVHTAGMLLLLIFAAVVLYNDIMKLI